MIYDGLLSYFAFNFNLRRYHKEGLHRQFWKNMLVVAEAELGVAKRNEDMDRARVRGLAVGTRRLCAGALARYEQTVRERMLVSGLGAGCGVCVQVHRYNLSKQSANECLSKEENARVCTGTPVHYEQTARERVSGKEEVCASVSL
jgi:hypothetical protein